VPLKKEVMSSLYAESVPARTRKRRLKEEENVERPTPNNLDKDGREPLHGVLEKRVLEGRLEGAGFRFADSKLGSDFELGGAMDFHVEFAALYQ